MEEKKIYIYGAGSLGSFVFDELQKLNVKVLGFIDNNTPLEKFRGLDVFPSENAQRGSKVLICVLNNFANVGEIQNGLLRSGVNEALTPPQVFFWLGENGVDSEWYWLTTDKSKVLAYKSVSDSFLLPMLDTKSAAVYRQVMNYRVTGIVDESETSQLSNQYIETGIDNFWIEPKILVDAGSFDGDTIQSLTDNEIIFKEIYAFEPDLDNFARLVQRARGLSQDIKCLPLALSSESGRIAFESGFGSGSRGVQGHSESDESVTAVRWDDSFSKVPVSHVKMDLEGAEMATLAGMEESLVRHQPNLAIAVYHKPDDFVVIGKFIVETLNYKSISLRTFAQQTFETVLFASEQKV